MIHVLYDETDKNTQLRVDKIVDRALEEGVIAVPFKLDEEYKMESQIASPNMKYVLPQCNIEGDQLLNTIFGRFLVTQTILEYYKQIEDIKGFTLVVGESKLARSIAASVMTTLNPVVLTSGKIDLSQSVDFDTFEVIIFVDDMDQKVEMTKPIPVLNYARLPITHPDYRQVIDGETIDDVVNNTMLEKVLLSGGRDLGFPEKEMEENATETN